MNLSNWIERQADFVPERCAIRFAGKDFSYAEITQRVKQLADVMASRLDVGHGDRVAYLGFNSPDIIVLLFACARLGAVLLPLNWRLAQPEHVYMLKRSDPCALFVQPEFIEHVEETRPDIGSVSLIAYGKTRDGWLSYDALISQGSTTYRPDIDPQSDDPVLLCYTSGTTGKPKGALLSNDALTWNAVNATHMHDLTSEDVVLTILPMFHVGGLNIQTLPALHAGATVVIHERFETETFFGALEQDGITLTLLVPTIMHALINDPRWQTADLSRLRMISIGSTIVPEQMVREVGARGVPLVQVYGSTETAPIAAYMPVRDTSARPASTGKAAIHCDIRLVDEEDHDVPLGEKGEILVRGPNVMTEYWNDPEATRAAFTDGWFHTEDIAHYDSGGFLYVDGRTKDMIISGGENVYPALIENVLSECASVKEVAVVGRPDDYWGEIVVAVVVANPAEQDAEEVLSFCEGRIAHFETPREVIFVDRLPRNAMGKIEKEAVREIVLQTAAEKQQHATG
jgi:fatty-acyl-CoA synthase